MLEKLSKLCANMDVKIHIQDSMVIIRSLNLEDIRFLSFHIPAIQRSNVLAGVNDFYIRVYADN